MKTKFLLFLFIIVLSFSSLSEGNWKNLFNINIFSKNSTREKTYHYPNGQLKSKQFFIKGKKSGVWEYYYENGQLKSTVTFLPNLSSEDVGTVINYDENGVILSDGKFINDTMVFLWNYYDENGKKIYSLNHNTGDIVLFNENEEPILNLSEKDLVKEMEKIQKEIKNDRLKSTKKENK